MTPTATVTGPAETPSSNPVSAQPAVQPAKDPGPAFKPPGSGWWPQVISLARYLTQTEVHTYAFSVAANVILSLFPFIVLTWTIERHLFHSPHMEAILTDMLRYFLPAHQDFVVRNMALLAHVRGRVQIISIVTLIISSTGVFLPLEVALNRVWNVPKNRSYLRNQVLSLALAFAVGVLALLSIAFTAAQTRLIEALFFGRENIVSMLLADSVLRISAAVLSISIFFLIYWILPNRKLPIRAVLPTAIVAGLLWEAAKTLYVLVLPWLKLDAAYGPFSVSVGLMIWSFLTGLILLAGAHFSATRHTLRLARQAEKRLKSR
jgi:membrane protein